jgi:hypothetical protein
MRLRSDSHLFRKPRMAHLVLSDALLRFMERTPVTVMSRAVIENSLSAEFIDRIFENSARRQYPRELMFSSVVELLSRVVFREQQSVHASYLWSADPSTSVASVYNKLNATETCVSEELVRQPANRMELLIQQCRLREEPIPGLHLRFIDGNYLAKTHHRIFKLRGLAVATLPGQTQVIYEYGTGLVRQICCSEDAHQQERSIVPALYDSIRKNDLDLSDCSYCMNGYIHAHETREAFYLTRHHAGTTLEELGPARPAVDARPGSSSRSTPFCQRRRTRHGYGLSSSSGMSRWRTARTR